MIEVKELRKNYGELAVLKGVNLEVRSGEILSIMGASGAGKTTFLQILGTLEAPDSGSLHFDGQDLLKLRGKALARFRNQHIGFVFQFHHLLPEFTAAENVAIPALIDRQNRREALRRASELLDFMGLKERLDHKPSALSGGEQQRVAVARALMNQPRVVLADEPTGNLDSSNAAEMHRLFASIRAEFATSFVIITHNKELAQTADRSVQMVDGRF